MKNIIISAFAVLLLFSCAKDKPSVNDNVSIFGYESQEEARKELGVYVKLFEATNASAQLQTTAYSNIDQEFGTIFGRFQESSSSPRTDGGKFKIEDLTLVHSSSLQQYIPEEGKLNPQESYDRISKYFGNTVSYNVENTSGSNISGTYYIPEEIRVEMDGLSSSSSTNAFAISPRDTRVRWNADTKNENGVVVHLTFDGFNINSGGYTDPDTKQERAIKFEDTGEGIIPSEFFNGIPEGGVFTIYFVRGAVDILEDDQTGQSFKFYSLTKDKKNLLSIK